jgi:hypothetical protein
MNLNGDINGGSVQQNEHVDLDFLDPITVSAQIFDAQANPLTNVTATSALGVNYLGVGTGPTAGVSEPGTVAVFVAGTVIIGISQRRRLASGTRPRVPSSSPL